MNLPVTSTLQRLFSRQPALAMLFQPSGYPMPSPRCPRCSMPTSWTPVP